ncbi:MAG TPA: tetratricopeptide repeat protein [Gammaproteobacteria bacterium]|nr:tetratricopeptide repeat protein [Gammaproteobacteria bacterium]
MAAGCASAPPSKPAVLAAERPFANADQEIGYHVFMGELAAERGDSAAAVREYLAAARLSPDPTLASHAALLAYGAGDDASAAEAAKRWQALVPGSRDAGHLLAVLEARVRDVPDAAAEIEALVKAGTDRSYSTAAEILEQETDAVHTLPVLQRIVADEPVSADAHMALAHAAMNFRRADLADSEARAALALDPGADEARVLLARALVAEDKPDEAVVLMKDRLREAGDDVTLRLAYAALLVEAQREKEARGELEALLKAHPENGEALYTLGLLALQGKDTAAARDYFKRLLKTGRRLNDAYYFLGNTAEMDKRYPEALDWYHRIQDGERWLAAQAGIGRSLVEGGTPDAAEEFFDDLVADDADEAVTLRLTEGQAFSDAGQPKLALKVYDAALFVSPDDTGLLYARALLLEQDGDPDAAESDLASILKRTPDDAEALNALGYMLTLHTSRYREAHDYIQKALDLDPDDPAIMDSMGWVEHRLGNEAAALDYLKKAYAAEADPEIAAHLVEVMLATGDAAGAHDLWVKALQTDPDNAVLRGLEPRFKP